MNAPDISNIESKPTAPKRDRIRIERKKYDELVSERGRLKAEVERLKAENADLKKDNDIWRKAGRETEEQKNRALAIIEKQKSEIIQSDNSWEAIISAYNALSKEVDDAKDERDALNVELSNLRSRIKADEQNANDRVKNWEDNYVWATHEMGTLRDQRDMARFIAALLGLAAVGFAVAVWIGKLIPVS